MSVTTNRNITIASSGDYEANNVYSATANTTSPAQRDIVALTNGNTIFTPPTSGVQAKALTIIPPAANTNLITVKGSTTDTGIALHLTDPSSIALGSTTASVYLAATTAIAGVTLIWT